MTDHVGQRPVWFRVPPAFSAIDLAGGPDDRARALLATLPPASGDGQAVIAAEFESFVQHLLAIGAWYAATCVLSADLASGRRSGGYFAISTPSMPGGGKPGLAAVAEGLSRSADGFREVRSIRLPCGPAVTATEDVNVTARDPVTGRLRTNRVAQDYAALTHPAGGELLLFSMSIDDAARRQEQEHIFMRILDSVSFVAPRG